MSYLARAKSVKEQVDGYLKLKKYLHKYCRILILDFDEQAAVEYQALKKAKVRLGTMDLKIAAIALSLNATVLTRNLADIHQIPHLKIENWIEE